MGSWWWRWLWSSSSSTILPCEQTLLPWFTRSNMQTHNPSFSLPANFLVLFFYWPFSYFPLLWFMTFAKSQKVLRLRSFFSLPTRTPEKKGNDSIFTASQNSLHFTYYTLTNKDKKGQTCSTYYWLCYNV